MDNGPWTEDKSTGRHHWQVGWLILILLLLLRIPYTIAIIYLMPIENQNGSAFYEVATYLLTAFLIWWERKWLNKFHIDTSALFLIIFIRPLQTLILGYWKVDSPLAFPHPLGLVLWGISLGLLIALWRSGFKPALVSSRSFAWIVAGIFIGIGLSVTENFQSFWPGISRAFTTPSRTALTPVLYSASLNLLYHLSFAPINEEPLFRGFLWGYLHQLKWKESLIWPFQAVLFTSAHVYLAHQFPLMFWVFIPLAGLLFGLLTWRSRSIAPAILAHGMVNGSVYFLIVLLILQSLH
jgi:membrane protease YdiL (CAAX protease family)